MTLFMTLYQSDLDVIFKVMADISIFENPAFENVIKTDVFRSDNLLLRKVIKNDNT